MRCDFRAKSLDLPGIVHRERREGSDSGNLSCPAFNFDQQKRRTSANATGRHCLKQGRMCAGRKGRQEGRRKNNITVSDFQEAFSLVPFFWKATLHDPHCGVDRERRKANDRASIAWML